MGGYSRLMGADEPGIRYLERWAHTRELFGWSYYPIVHIHYKNDQKERQEKHDQTP